MDNEIKDELQDDIFTQNEDPIPTTENYNDDSIVHLEDMEHIRRRPGMYIGKLGDGASQDDGIYVLIKEVIDNSIDEFTSGFGKKIEVKVDKAEIKNSIILLFFLLVFTSPLWLIKFFQFIADHV